MIMEENTQLPVERTKDEILHSRPIVSNNKGSDLYVSLESARIAMQTYADQYATKLHQAEQEIAELKRWKEEAKAVINPIYGYADTLKVPLGASKPEAVIKHAKEAKKLLHEVLVMNEAWGDLPGEFINKVKTFLYGE